MKGRFLFSALITLSLVVGSTAPVKAVTPPDFPACSSQITAPVIASYSNGTHGVPGDSNTYTGKDTVYALDGKNKVVQCLCIDNGNGIQTNWWKVSSLVDSDIKILQNLGWILVQNGSAWGLDADPYMAKNSAYSCGSKAGGTGGGDNITTTTANLIGLAGTGNAAMLFNLFLFSVASTGIAILIFKFPRKQA